jgi:folate-binding protein YgfZ
MRTFHLDQAVISVRGNVAQFLNGLTTNTLNAPLNAFVNLHGRLIVTFFQKQLSDHEFLLAIPPSAVDALLGHLDRYAKLSGTKLIPTRFKAYMDIETAQVIFTEETISNQVSDQEFTLFRLNQNLPLMNIDYQAEEFILNIDPYDKFVSYTKGCFLGQEPVAKVHNRSKPSKKLIVKFEDECSQEEWPLMTSKAKDPATGRTKGFIFVKNN